MLFHHLTLLEMLLHTILFNRIPTVFCRLYINALTTVGLKTHIDEQ